MELTEAKHMVSALADGNNPVTGEVLPAESPYNDPQIIRALFTVLESLKLRPARKSSREKREENLANGRPANAGLPWTDESRDELAEKYEGGSSVDDLARHFERTSGAILSELVRQGLVDHSERSQLQNQVK